MRYATLFFIALCGCTTTPEGPRFAANGWLNPYKSGEPELIGIYDTREECEAAVRGWLGRQVVGNPISGECAEVDSK